MSMERDSLLREVADEIRRDQMKKLWDQYGTFLIGGVAALLFGIGGYKWWESRTVAAAERTGQQFEEALDLATSGKPEEAQKLLRTIGGSSGSGYPVLAQLAIAGQAVKAGKPDEAGAAYDTAAKQAKDPLVRDYARLLSASLKIDSADFTEVQNRLNDLIGDKSPWRFMARELLGLSAIRAGKMDEARNLLAPLSADPRAPAAIRERAGALMNIVVETELERTQPAGKIELEGTEQQSGTPETAPPKQETPRTKAVTPKGGAAKGK